MQTLWSSNVTNVPKDVIYKNKIKFKKKILAWVAISARRKSRVFLVSSGLGLNQEGYFRARIIKRSPPFIGGVTCLNNKAFHLSACGSQMLTESLRLLACGSYFYV